jgi:SpoVK/Ycf46/Vps4 family AAA+-type ATPase
VSDRTLSYNRGMSESLALLIQSGHPLILIETTDEDRAAEMVRAAGGALQRKLCDWSLTRGLWELDEQGQPKREHAPLKYVLRSGEQTVFVFRDLGPHLKDAAVHRLLRDLSPVCRTMKCALVCLEYLPFPAEASRLVVRFDVGWPTAEELERTVRETYQRIQCESLYEVTSHITRREMEQLVQTLRGLTTSEAERVIASAIYQDYRLCGSDLSRIVDAKRQLLGSTGCLESIVADFSPEDIGGLHNLKDWLRVRRGGFSQEAREFGVEPPRGVLMLGVQGCGKSLCAKVVASDWKMPLLRLDPGVLYQKYIGESENRLRQALRQAEAMAPVVLWIDEIEKAFASASADSSDGGLSQRMFGTLLTWMQDHRHPIFLVATANDVSQLPPELMRKGRFDEMFFIDLPDAAARARILGIHLSRRNRDPAAFDLERLGAAADGFSGAELEQAVRSGLYAAFSQQQELSTEILLNELGQTRSLSAVMPERIAQLQAWARERCVPAD